MRDVLWHKNLKNHVVECASTENVTRLKSTLDCNLDVSSNPTPGMCYCNFSRVVFCIKFAEFVFLKCHRPSVDMYTTVKGCFT